MLMPPYFLFVFHSHVIMFIKRTVLVLSNSPNNSASKQFFYLYYRAYYELLYFEKYKLRSYSINKLISALLAVASIGGIAAWYSIKLYQIIWAIFVGAMQILQAMLPHLEYAKQVTPLTFLIQERTTIFNNMTADWLAMDSFSDSDIQSLINKYTNELSYSEERFLSNVSLPSIPSLVHKADQEARAYFEYTYDTEFIRSDNYVR